jgi:hypothetical protein
VADFQATADDLAEVIARARWSLLRHQVSWPVVAALAAAALFPWSAALASLAFGMALAWSVSLYLGWRSLAQEYLWRFAWLQEPLTIDVGSEGIRLRSARGDTFVSWNDELVVRNLSTCFVLEDIGEPDVPFVILPKRVLGEEERVFLQGVATGPEHGTGRATKPSS